MMCDQRSRPNFKAIMGLLQYACLIAAIIYTRPADGKKWTCGTRGGTFHIFNPVDFTLTVDMHSLRPSTECTLILSDTVKISNLVEIEVVEDSFNSSSCGPYSNKLTLETSSPDGNQQYSSTLICGNEMVKLIRVAYPVKLKFHKVLNSGLLKFHLELKDVIYDKRSSFHEVRKEPRIFYSALYQYSYLKDISSRSGLYALFASLDRKPVLFQLRNINPTDRSSCKQYISFAGGQDGLSENICGTELSGTVIIPDYVNINIYYTDDHGNNPRFEMEYRSLEEGPTIDCGESVQNIDVSESTYIRFRLSYPRVKCAVTFSPLKVGHTLMITNVTSGNVMRELCESYKLEVFVGGLPLPANECSHASFGFIRGRPDEKIKIQISIVTVYSRPINGIDVGFMVETASPGNFALGVNAHHSPSYSWVPRTIRREYAFEVRSIESSCVEFSTWKGNLDSKPLVADSISLYNGRGSDVMNDEIFELTKDCKGGDRSEAFIYSSSSRITTAVTKSYLNTPGFWFVFSQTDTKPCPRPPTSVSVSDFEKNLFLGFAFKKFMMCKFIFRHDDEYLHFKGYLSKTSDAKMYAVEGSGNSYVLADFTKTSLSKWLYGRHISLYFSVGNSTHHVDPTFNFKSQGLYELRKCGPPENINIQGAFTRTYYTPNYPNYLISNESCSWTFRQVYSLSMYIHVSITMALSCDSSTKFLIGGLEDDQLQPICDTRGETVLVFPKDVRIEIHGGPDHVVEGFQFKVQNKKLDYIKECNKTHVVDFLHKNLEISGRLTPKGFLIPFICYWRVQSTYDGDRLSINITHVQFSDCHDNSITIYDGLQFSNTKMLETCDAKNRVLYTSRSEVLILLSIKSAVPDPYKFGFTVSILSDACTSQGIDVRARSSLSFITSPGYPNDYPKVYACEWRIRSFDYEIEVQFVDIDMEDHKDCHYDYVAIYNGETVYSPLLKRYCGSITSRPKFRSDGRILTIQFRSDYLNNGYRGFKLEFRTKQFPSSDLVNDGSSHSNNDSDSSNQTGVVVGGCLAAIVGIIGIIFISAWLVHRKRMGGRQRRRRRRSHPVPSVHFNNSTQESSVFMINPVIYNTGAIPPPPYPGITNEAFLEELPPSYTESLNMTTPTVNLPQTPREPPPPSYSATVSGGNQAQSDDRDGRNESLYDNPTDESSSAIYETLEQPRTPTDPNQNTGQATRSEAAASHNQDSANDSENVPEYSLAVEPNDRDSPDYHVLEDNENLDLPDYSVVSAPATRSEHNGQAPERNSRHRVRSLSPLPDYGPTGSHSSQGDNARDPGRRIHRNHMPVESNSRDGHPSSNRQGRGRHNRDLGPM